MRNTYEKSNSPLCKNPTVVNRLKLFERVHIDLVHILQLNLMRPRTLDTFGALQAVARQVEFVSKRLERSHRAFNGMNEEERPRVTRSRVERHHSGAVGVDQHLVQIRVQQRANVTLFCSHVLRICAKTNSK